MKMSPDFEKAVKKMEPGVITQTGFLGDDDRNLADIIEHDEELMVKTGLDWDLLSEKMNELTQKGEAGLGEPVTVDGKWTVWVYEARGKLPCPFGDGMFNKITTSVINKKNNKAIIYSQLSLHLLKEHHFLQGKGSDFRLEPGLLKEVLEL